MFRGNPQHTGVATASIPLTLPLEPNWEFHKSTRGAGVTSSPAVWEGIVFFGCDDGKLYALEAKTGKELWEFKTGASVWSPPAVCDGMILVVAGKLYAIEARTGKKLWESNHIEIDIGTDILPAVGGGMVLVGNNWSFKAFGAERTQRNQQ
jgi:outer membrane protein assembly factor BamB